MAALRPVRPRRPAPPIRTGGGLGKWITRGRWDVFHSYQQHRRGLIFVKSSSSHNPEKDYASAVPAEAVMTVTIFDPLTGKMVTITLPDWR
jgi:hypothetical protein